MGPRIVQIQWSKDRSIGEFTREADESESEFLDRVRAVVRPYANRKRVNVVACSAIDSIFV